MDIDINIVDDLTPAELYVLCEAKKKKNINDIKDKYDLEIINAYYTAGFGRMKKINNIKKYFSKRDQVRKTSKQLLEKIKSLHAFYDSKK